MELLGLITSLYPPICLPLSRALSLSRPLARARALSLFTVSNLGGVSGTHARAPAPDRIVLLHDLPSRRMQLKSFCFSTKVLVSSRSLFKRHLGQGKRRHDLGASTGAAIGDFGLGIWGEG